MRLLALGKTQLNLGPALGIEIDRQRHQRHPLALYRAEQLVDLAFVQKQFSRSFGLVVEPVAVAVFGNIRVDQPHLAVAHFGIAFRNRRLARTQCLHLGALQRKPGLDEMHVGVGAPIGLLDRPVARKGFAVHPSRVVPKPLFENLRDCVQ